MQNKNLRHPIYILLFIMIIFTVYGAIMPTLGKKTDSSDFEIIAMPVGEADCILIHDGTINILVDTGEKENANDIIDILNKRKISTIDALILTHFDKDHIGGAPEIVKKLTIEDVYMPNYTPNNPKRLEQLLDAIPSGQIKYVNDTLKTTLGTMNLTLWPAQNPDRLIAKNIENHDEYDNDLSLISMIECAGKRFLLMGDADTLRLKEILDDSALCDEMQCDWIKLPCHGKYSKTLSTFLDTVKPTYAVICSDEIKKKLSKKLEEKDISYWLTDENGITTYIAEDALKNTTTIR